MQMVKKLIRFWSKIGCDRLSVTSLQKSDGDPETFPVKMPVPVVNGQKDARTNDPRTWHNSLPEAPSLASSETKTGGNKKAHTGC